MRPLTQDDLLPLDEYAARRREFFDSHSRYLDRYRRVRLGPRLTLLFENRQTLWFRVQELIRIARLTTADLVQQELDLYNRLLPSRDRLQAALLIDVNDETRLTEELAPWQSMRGEELRLCVGFESIVSRLVTCRPEDRCIGAAQWVQFHLSATAREVLSDLRQPAHFTISLPTYSHDSSPLSDDVRQSLIGDLELSDRS